VLHFIKMVTIVVRAATQKNNFWAFFKRSLKFCVNSERLLIITLQNDHIFLGKKGNKLKRDRFRSTNVCKRFCKTRFFWNREGFEVHDTGTEVDGCFENFKFLKFYFSSKWPQTCMHNRSHTRIKDIIIFCSLYDVKVKTSIQRSKIFFRKKNYCPTYKKKLEVHTISHFFGIFFFQDCTPHFSPMLLY